jgi:formylglycine-generating enzyme required for sulfatase activity
MTRYFSIISLLSALLAVAEPLSFDLATSSGWNLVAVPISIADDPDTLFAPGPAWEWTGARFETAETIVPGKAYWVHQSAAQSSRTVTGAPVEVVTRELQAGWNLIGGIGYPPYAALPLPLSVSPPGSVSAVWGWENGEYVKLSQLAPGRGAWVFAKRECTILLSSTAMTVGDYLVVDFSAGTNAASYPVSSLSTIPDPVPETYKTCKLLLRRIPAGTFTMGSPSDELGRSSSETQHSVTLTQDVYVGVFEVTQKQWELVMGNRPANFSSGSWEQRPVEQVSYNDIRGSSAGAGWPASNGVDADSFLGRLRARTGLAFDLPTEAQWEYACRAGTTSALNNETELSLTHCGFDANLDAVAWYCGNDANTTEAVGQKLGNTWGLYDMHGNVNEWCLDWYGSYGGTVTDPPGASSGSFRVIRGGSWSYDARYCRSALRRWDRPGYRFRNFGLRLALPAGQ